MNFDNSRFNFNPLNDYFGVVMEQGRVQLDSDWNEWLAELRRRIQAGTLDTLGRAVYPSTTPNAFQISVSAGPKVMIGPGRMYVDGLLVENHGDPYPSPPTQWDPALEELSNTPQPPSSPPPPPPAPGAIDYTAQPYFPNAALPTGSDPFVAYLDVWTRPVTYLEDSNLIDPAVGVDTTGRLQTVWQVKVVPAQAGTTCGSISFPALSSGQLSTTTTPNTPSGPCCITDSTGYTGMENQFYRVEIHQPGQPPTVPASLPFTYPLPAGATFKFSRDNGSVQTAVTAITPHNNSAGVSASLLTVLSLGRDQTLGFHPGDWIEILDDVVELTFVPNGQLGQLYQIDSVDPSGPYIQLTQAISLPFLYTFPPDPTTTHTRIVRWDQSGKIYESDGTKLTNVWVDLGAAGSTGDIPVPPPGTMLVLENGVTVLFNQSSATTGFLCGDFWNFAARTATGKVDTLNQAPPRGIHHHYAPLAVLNLGTTPAGVGDCRTEWPPPTTAAECCCCCSVTVGGTQYPTIQSAIQAVAALPSGGEVCIPAGIYYENVFIEGLSDIVIRGCGAQTRVASLALKPSPAGGSGVGSGTGAGGASGGGAAGGASGTTIGTPTPYAAVFTMSGTKNITFTDFVIEAADSECGILLDGSGTLGVPPGGIPQPQGDAAIVVDTTIENLNITASTMPAVLAQDVIGLKIEQNLIAMENVPSLWPAVWVTGSEIHIDGNWVTMQGQQSNGWLHPGGIQIAAGAIGVYVTDNEIDGGSFNGITLGSLTTTNPDGNETGQIIGVLVYLPGPCSTSSTLQTGGSGSGSQTGFTVVAGGSLTGIQIERNRISNMGLCGIGPAGFFDLDQITEVISVTNLEITANTIQGTLQSSITPSTSGNSQIGYGAICLPDVQNVIVRDNTITVFGDEAGAEVCGIYILHGGMIEINRNQVNETRTWDEASSVSEQQNVPRGGIYVTLATPPAFSSSTLDFSVFTNRDAASMPLYQPAMPALRVEHNVVRVPLNITLYALGIGPFSIVDNHLGCGGTVSSSKDFEIADTVLIINVGMGIEFGGLFSRFSQIGSIAGTTDTTNFGTSERTLPLGGTVLFTNNVCQLEKVTGQVALASVMIVSLDQIVFSNNQCWVDGAFAAFVDAMLAAGTVQVTSNRFQESLLPTPWGAAFSGITFGLMSVTADNISTLCLLAFAPQAARVYANNISLADVLQPGICENKWGTTFKANP